MKKAILFIVLALAASSTLTFAEDKMSDGKMDDKKMSKKKSKKKTGKMDDKMHDNMDKMDKKGS